MGQEILGSSGRFDLAVVTSEINGAGRRMAVVAVRVPRVRARRPGVAAP
jgi:hypothetical protein